MFCAYACMHASELSEAASESINRVQCITPIYVCAIDNFHLIDFNFIYIRVYCY